MTLSPNKNNESKCPTKKQKYTTILILTNKIIL